MRVRSDKATNSICRINTKELLLPVQNKKELINLKKRSWEMRETFEKAKELKSQIAFFAFLCIALLLGKLLMIGLSGTKLSESIELEYAGISVSMPKGTQWDGEQQWRYGDNIFYLTSTLRDMQGQPAGSIHCRYLLESTNLTGEELLSRKVSEFSGEVGEKGEARNGGLILKWVNIKIPKSPYEIYYGTTKLPTNHLIEIEIQKIDLNFRAGEIFKDILDNIQFENKPSIQAGIETIKEIKRKGATSFVNTSDSPSAFLIMDSRGKPTGFTLDVFSPLHTNEPFVFNAEGLYYLRQPYSTWESVSYYGNDNISEYIWKSELITSNSKRETQATLDKNGIINLTALSVPPSEKKYTPSNSSIPEVFTDILFGQILASETERINVEFIESRGKITPVTISKIEPEVAKPTLSKSAYALEMNFLDGSGRSKKIYLDDQGQIIREQLIVPLQGRSFSSTSRDYEVLTLVRSTAENLATQFPEQAEQIMQKISNIDVN
jgi:hypothetical protein